MTRKVEKEPDSDHHIITQLRKAVNLRLPEGLAIKFRDRQKAAITSEEAMQVLEHYNSLRTTISKEDYGNRLGASHEEFQAALKHKVKVAKKKHKITLPGSPAIGGNSDNWQEYRDEIIGKKAA